MKNFSIYMLSVVGFLFFCFGAQMLGQPDFANFSVSQWIMQVIYILAIIALALRVAESTIND